ncbi:hypothetical protein SPONN_617 [uncultured Candidatus Thioglobus sp.]|nr:hypothetical protein SPONN_617 [uncultured Candidatus Thioglobus sp.]
MKKTCEKTCGLAKMPFEHLKFTRHWELSEATAYQLGQCQGLVDALSRVPLGPKTKQELKYVALAKGAQASTAIEGNTLTDEEIQKVLHGKPLAPSKNYQAQEVGNIIKAMNEIANDMQPSPALITPKLLRRYHYLVGKNLSEPFNATAGNFAQSQRIVADYRCPPPGRGKNQVEGLVKRLCQWLRQEFRFESGKQSFSDGIVQAIVTHVYIEWIHPFDDGNGRTGRLVEFYLLLRAGVPDICAHILSNHYNTTRPEYYAHIRQCQNEGQLTSFIAYAVTGFLDGLNEVWDAIADELLKRAWRGYVYDKFAEIKWSKPTFKRRRRLLLDMALFQQYDIDSIQLASAKIAREYAKVNISTLKRDISSLIEAGLLVEDREAKTMSANIGILVGLGFG